MSTKHLDRSERLQESCSRYRFEQSERLKGSWPTYQSERLNEFLSTFELERFFHIFQPITSSTNPLVYDFFLNRLVFYFWIFLGFFSGNQLRYQNDNGNVIDCFIKHYPSSLNKHWESGEGKSGTRKLRFRIHIFLNFCNRQKFYIFNYIISYESIFTKVYLFLNNIFLLVSKMLSFLGKILLHTFRPVSRYLMYRKLIPGLAS